MKKQMMRYLIVGGGAVCIDYLSYFAMMRFLSTPPAYSKGISYVLGAIFAFFVNKRWTFESDVPTHKAFGKFAILYLSTFTANVAINGMVLWLMTSKNLAFFFATATSIILNYIGQKFWVFRRQS